jgi:hypothetical protein
MTAVSNWGTPVVVGKRMSSEKKEGIGAAGVLAGAGTVKGATEYQHRVKGGVAAARTAALDAVATADRSYALAREAKGKPGPLAVRPDGAKTRHRISPAMQREAAQNNRLNVHRTRVKYKAAERLAPKKLRVAQRTKMGGLAAVAGGAYLGLKGLREGGQRRRAEKWSTGA